MLLLFFLVWIIFNGRLTMEIALFGIAVAGAVFGFTDGNTYTLDKNYTFTFDGSNWTMEATEPAPQNLLLRLLYRLIGKL